MAAPAVTDVRNLIAARLSSIPKLRGHGYVPGQFSPPAAIVGLPRIAYDETFQRGTDRHTYTVWVVVARQTDRTSEQQVAAYLSATGAQSVKAALRADKTLGGAVSDLHVVRGEPVDFRFGEAGQEQVYVGAEFEVVVIAEGK